MLDEMIQDRVESGQIVRGVRGSVRVVTDRKVEIADSVIRLEPLRRSPSLLNEPTPVAMQV